MDLSNLTPILEESFPSKARTTLPRKPIVGPLSREKRFQSKQKGILSQKLSTWLSMVSRKLGNFEIQPKALMT
jgi:hypothetical protein